VLMLGRSWSAMTLDAPTLGVWSTDTRTSVTARRPLAEPAVIAFPCHLGMRPS